MGAYKRKRILVLTNNIGGLHSFRKEVIKAIVDSSIEVYISHPDIDDCSKYFEDLGCIMIPLKFEGRGINPFKDLILLYNYIRLIKEINPDTVLTYTIKPNVYGGLACRLCHKPQLPNITGLGDAVENGGLLQKIICILYKVSLKAAPTIFFQNESNLNFFLQHRLLQFRYILLPGSGVNLDYHTYQEYPKCNNIKFLLIARLIKDKGVDEFLKMAQVIKSKYPCTEFHILGSIDNFYQSRIEELVKRNIINYLGKTNDIRPYLKEVHCTILPSYHEGMSNVNLESQANGRPVITTNVSGCKETIKDNISGYLVIPRSSDDLINKVEKFIMLSYESKVNMGIAGRLHVESEFNRNIVVNKYLKEIEQINENN